MSINRAMISGNLTRDADLRETGSGMPVLSFAVAVNDRRKNPQTGEWEDYPNFIDCTMFGARASALQKYLVKGTKVSIEGKLRWSQWERDGQKRSKIDVVVNEVDFMTRRTDGGSYNNNYNEPNSSQSYNNYNQTPNYQPAPSEQQNQQTPQNQAYTPSFYDDDIPF